MFLNLLDEIRLSGPALSEPFVREKLEVELNKRKLLPKSSGSEGEALEEAWRFYRRKLLNLANAGGALRVFNHVFEPLLQPLGYAQCENAQPVQTREGLEEGGTLFVSQDGAKLRLWSTDFDTDLDAPSRRGHAYRFSPLRIAQRVLLASGERVGLLTNGVELRLLICDPARPDSQIILGLESVWKRKPQAPDSYLLLLALASPAGVKALPEIVEQARLQQTRVTKELRTQARQAVEGFLQTVLDHPANQDFLTHYPEPQTLARQLWREGLITIYRLLFILKLESSDDPARLFGFASTSLWRNSFSPSVALTRYVRLVLDEHKESGGLLEGALRTLFRMFAEGLACTEFVVKPLGGALFGSDATPLLSRLHWDENGVAWLLDRLLWTASKGNTARQRVHYGPLDVEDLGRVYEALLELEPGIASEPMCRLRRNKLEVVTALAQGERYRPPHMHGSSDPLPSDNGADDAENDENSPDESGDEENESTTKSSKVQWIEEIAPGRFYLRVGLGRKASGSFYTPHSFVRFLIQETLGPLCAERSPHDDPQPLAILAIKVLDNSMGSGHFLVEAARFLGEKLYEAVRLCDEHARQEEHKAEHARSDDARQTNLLFAQVWRQRIVDLPDPNDELLRYLPSHAPEGSESGLSERKAQAICKRLVAVHCLYGVDKNPLAVELAKLALWLECHAEGLPLTFLDHRLVVGDSLTGPFFHHLLNFPGSGGKLEDIYSQELTERFSGRLQEALRHVSALEASVGVDEADLQAKRFAKSRLDNALLPFRLVAAAWAGGVMLGKPGCDDEAYKWLVDQVTTHGELPLDLTAQGGLCAMVAAGLGLPALPSEAIDLAGWLAEQATIPALPFDLTFPEVFFPTGDPRQRHGFDVLLGNPPWDKLRVERRDLMASINLDLFSGKESAGVGSEHELLEKAFESFIEARSYEFSVSATKSLVTRMYANDRFEKIQMQRFGDSEAYRLFLVRASMLCHSCSRIGYIVGGGLAKNPADAPLRRFIFEQYRITVFAHYLNLKQLFGGASSRIAFVIFAGDRVNESTKTRIGYEFKTFDDLIPLNQRDARIKWVDYLVIKNQLDADGDLTQTVASSKANIKGKLKVIEALDELQILISDDLHRVSAKPALKDISEILPQATDARLPNIVPDLVRKNFACCYDGRSIDFFSSLPTEKSGKWLPQVKIVLDLRLSQSNRLHERIRFFRLAWRATCGHPATNIRSARACILPPGTTAANSILLESLPSARPNVNSLIACSIINSFSLDFQVRPGIQSNLNKAVINRAFWPTDLNLETQLLAHSCLRLISINTLYQSLWQEQLGDTWREPTPLFTWPVLAGDDARWAVRAAIDAVVAQAYGLNREQYAYILSTFSHKSYPAAPRLCLDRFDELHTIGLEAFTRKYDPYWDIPLNENLPQPVIELPGVGERVEQEGPKQLGFGI